MRDGFAGVDRVAKVVCRRERDVDEPYASTRFVTF